MDSIFQMVAQDSKPRQSEMARLEEQRKVTQEIYDERGVLRDGNVTETLAAPTNADEYEAIELPSPNLKTLNP